MHIACQDELSFLSKLDTPEKPHLCVNECNFAKCHVATFRVWNKLSPSVTPRGKSGMALGLGSSPKFWCSLIIFLQRLGLATSNLARSWGLSRLS